MCVGRQADKGAAEQQQAAEERAAGHHHLLQAGSTCCPDHAGHWYAPPPFLPLSPDPHFPAAYDATINTFLSSFVRVCDGSFKILTGWLAFLLAGHPTCLLTHSSLTHPPTHPILFMFLLLHPLLPPFLTFFRFACLLVQMQFYVIKRQQLVGFGHVKVDLIGSHLSAFFVTSDSTAIKPRSKARKV